MRRPLTIVALLATAGCVGQTAQHLSIQAQSSSPVPVSGSAAERVAYGDAQYALGNVALALESYRRAMRQAPEDMRALVGAARCYDAMGRFDLARRHYESALALAPADTSILAALATSLSQAGDTAGAAQVRQEIASLVDRSATVVLPAATPAPEARVAKAEPASLPPAAALPMAADERAAARPRLERLSLSEVALVTKGPIRWAALKLAERSPAPVLILNAARKAGLAARTRDDLVRAGWRRLAIGDAPQVREHSLVLYPDARREEAERLARGLPTARLRRNADHRIVMLLGKDAGTSQRYARER